jgi:hypothetical protein
MTDCTPCNTWSSATRVLCRHDILQSRPMTTEETVLDLEAYHRIVPHPSVAVKLKSRAPKDSLVRGCVLLESPAKPAPDEPKPIAASPSKPHTKHIRFDATSPVFEEIAGEYRRALAQAERLWKRFEKAEDEGDFSKAKRLKRKLDAADARLEAAREALQGHITATTKHSMRSRMKRWSLRQERLRVSHVA